MVFVAFTQHYIHSTVTHVGGVKGYCTLYTGPPHPSSGEGYLFEPSALWVKQFTTSQSEEAALLTFLGLDNYKGDCRQDAQPIPNSLN